MMKACLYSEDIEGENENDEDEDEENDIRTERRYLI